jgi:hypothetical protein
MDRHLQLATFIADLLDNQFKIGRFSFGIDPVLGLFPGLGDLISAVLSFYLVWIAIEQNLPKRKVARMVFNILFDFGLGAIPVVGDISDFFYKSNARNLKILRELS